MKAFGIGIEFTDGTGEGVVASISDAQAAKLREILRSAKRRGDVKRFEVTKLSDNVLSLAGLQGLLNRNNLPAPQ
jgi:hypothetical protein